MRPSWMALLLSAVGACAARAAEHRYFDDCTLRAVQFINDKEGWAAGDDGVVWHTLDGGKNWERQKTGTRGSLRSICFLNFDNGWIAGGRPGGSGPCRSSKHVPCFPPSR